MRAREFIIESNKIASAEQGVAEGLDQSLSSMAGQDQAERNAYKAWVKAQPGAIMSAEMGAKYAQLKNRSKLDVFGDAVRQDQFMKMKFDFDKFTDKDWKDYWVMAQHCDKNRDFQKNALSIIKKYQGEDHIDRHYQYLYDRISCGTTGKQKYGTQDICGKDKQGVAEGLIDYAQRKLGLKWGKIGDVVNGSVVAEYLDSQDDSMDTDRYINSKFKLINITANEAEKYREISDLNGWPSDTPLEKVKGWGIDDYKMDRIRKNDVTYQSLMKHTPVVSSRGFIINGNHRVARALEMGIDPIPILKELPQGMAEGLK